MLHLLHGSAQAATGAFAYAGLCAAATLTGRGLLRLLKHGKEEADAQWFLAAPLTLLFWTLALAVPAAFQIRVRTVSPWLWSVSILLSISGLLPLRRPIAWKHLGAWLLCLTLPAVCMAERFAAGLTQTTAAIGLDGWFYMAGGTAVYENGRHVYQGADPIGRFGSYAHDHRFVSFSYLAFLASMDHRHDTCAVGALLQAWALFVLACAVQFFWRTQHISAWMRHAATALTIVGSWTATLVWGNWFDQELAVVYLPIMGGLLYAPSMGQRTKAVLLGCALAGLMYTFPEGAAPIGMGLAALLAVNLGGARAHWRGWLIGASLALLVCVALVLPGMQTLHVFMHTQNWRLWTGCHFADAWFGGMCQRRLHPGAFWGLGGETFANPHTRASNAGGVLLTLLAVAGLFRLARTGSAGVAAAGILVCVVVVTWLGVLGNAYVSLKMLGMYQWILAGAVVSGIGVVVELVRRPGWQLVAASSLTAAVLACNIATLYGRPPIAYSKYAATPLREFREISQVKHIVGGEPLFIAVEDEMADLLAIYYSRSGNLHLATVRGWMRYPGVLYYVETGEAVAPAERYYVLCERKPDPSLDDVQAGELVWHNDIFELRRHRLLAGSGPQLVTIDPQMGRSRDAHGQSSFWMAEFLRTTMYVVVPSAGTLRLEGTFQPGASLGQNGPVPVVVTKEGRPGPSGRPEWAARSMPDQIGPPDDVQQLALRPGPGHIDIPVHAGANRLFLQCTAQPQRHSNEAAGLRMLLGILNARLLFQATK